MELEVSKSDQILTLTINRPEKRNALTQNIIDSLTQQLITADNSDVRVIVLQGSGDNFCAGADINWMKDNPNHVSLSKLLVTLNNCTKPTIGIIKGTIYGGGIGLVACCDIVIGSEDSEFCFSEAKLGLAPAIISPYIRYTMGSKEARRWMLSAEKFGADTAYKLGLIHEVVKKKQLEKRSEAIISSILKNSPKALAAIKKMLISDINLENNIQLIQNLSQSEQGQEGLSAFLEQRTPSWNKK